MIAPVALYAAQARLLDDPSDPIGDIITSLSNRVRACERLVRADVTAHRPSAYAWGKLDAARDALQAVQAVLDNAAETP